MQKRILASGLETRRPVTSQLVLQLHFGANFHWYSGYIRVPSTNFSTILVEFALYYYGIPMWIYSKAV